MLRYYRAGLANAHAIQTRENTTLFGIYAYGTEADLLDDLIYYANTGNERTNITANTDYTGVSDNYFNASNTDALNAAIEKIFQTIVQALGVSSVQISDGTTHQVTTSTGTVSELLEVDESSYQYWLKIPIDGNNTFQRVDLTSGETVTYTVSADGSTVTWGSKSVTVNGKIESEGGQRYLKYEWTGANDLYNYAPPAAQFANSSVDWNLGSVGTLLDGVTYSVTFDVYPSQTTLDYVADIKNDPGESGAWSKLDPNIRQYLDVNGNLKTNTEATLKWTDTRNNRPGTSEYTNPDPVETAAVEELAISKKWENELDSQKAKPVELNVTRDGVNTYSLELSDDNDWEGNVFISIGILRTKNGQDEILVPGHDFTFTEPADLTYHWELDVPTVRPMLVNGEVTMLIKVDAKHPVPNGATTHTINGSTYYEGKAGAAALTATNERRSSLLLTKVVEGEDAPADATFPFTLNVVNSGAPETAPADDPKHETDWWVWFSVRDKNNEPVNGAVTSGATAENGTNGWYYGVSGQNIVLNMKAGYTIRINNLPTGTIYTLTERTLPTGFTFKEAKLTIAEGEGADTTFSGGQASTGTIQATNTLYKVTYTNKYELIDVDVRKEWVDANNQDGIRPDSLELTLNGVPEGTATPTPEITKNGNIWTYVWKALPKNDAQGNPITYTVSENTVPTGYECTGSPANDGGTITNTHTPEVISVTANKVWKDANNQDGIRPASVQVQLKADGENQGDPKTLDDSSSWTASWDNLPKYKNGAEITYAVDEVETAVITGTDGPGTYAYEVTGSVADGFTVTNTHTPEVVTKTGKKIWDDEKYSQGEAASIGNANGYARKSITITLTGSDGNAYSVTLDGTADTAPTGTNAVGYESAAWEYTFVNLPKYANGTAITYTVSETAPAGWTATPSGNDVKNTPNEDEEVNELEMTLEKTDKNTGNKISGAVFTLTGPTADETQDITVSSEGTTITFTKPGTYTLKEKSAPTGYEAITAEYRIVVNKELNKIEFREQQSVWMWIYNLLFGEGTDTTFDSETNTLTIPNPPTTTSVDAKKVWNDNANKENKRPASVTFQLYKQVGDADPVMVDGKTATLTAGDEWTTTFSDLPAYEDGSKITYTVKEMNGSTPVENGGKLDDNYTASYSADGLTVTNSMQTKPVKEVFTGSSTTSIDGQVVEPGQELTYKITYKNTTGMTVETATIEDKIPAHTTFVRADNGGTESGGTVTWTLNNVADGEEKTVSMVVKVEDDVSGEVIKNDAVVKHGQNEYHTNEVTNPTTVNVNFPVKKVLSVPEGLQGPATWSYTVDVAANDGAPETETMTGTVNQDTPSTTFGPFTYKQPGTYTYKVTETGSVSGVTNDSAAITGKTVTVTVAKNESTGALTATVSPETGITFTNTYNVGKTSIDLGAKKELEGQTLAANQFSFTLTEVADADGTALDDAYTETVKNKADGSVAFTSIEYTAPGTHYYKIVEVVPSDTGNVTYDENAETGYIVTVTVSDNGNGTLTATKDKEPADVLFTNTVEKTNVKVTKVWDDEDNKDKLRTNSVSVQLYANGTATGDPVNVAGDSWTYTWEGLDKNLNGEAITYTVDEIPTPKGYTKSISADEDDTDSFAYTVTNTHVPSEKDVTPGTSTTSIDGEVVAAGQVLTYTVSYTNNTDKVGTVTVTDKIPDHTDNPTDISDGGTYDASERTITWTIENVEPGKGDTVSFKVTVDEDANGELIANTAKVRSGESESDSNTVTTSVPVKNVYNASEEDIDGKTVQVGDVLTYKVSFELRKEGYAVVTDEIPEGTTYVANTATSSAGVAGTLADGKLTWNLGSENDPLPASTYTVEFQVKVNVFAVVLDTINNTAYINVNNHGDVETNEVKNTPETTKVTVTKVWDDDDNKDELRPSSITFNLVATVDGKTVTLPDKITLAQTIQPDNDGKWPTAQWTGLPAKNDDGKQISWTVTEEPIKGYTTTVGDTTGSAKDGFEITVTNTHKDNVKTVSYGTVENRVDGQLVGVGETLTYTINYVNNTNKTRAITVTDEYPSNTEFVDAANGGTESNGTVTWSIPNVEPGKGDSVSFRVKVKDSAAGETLENTGVVNDGENKFKTNMVPVSVPEKDVQDASGTSIKDGDVKVGDELTYVISYKLLENSENVVVTDVVPEGTEFVSASEGGTESDGTVTWSYDEKAAGEYSVSFTVKVTPDAVTLDKINNTGSIKIGENDPAVTNKVTNNVVTSVAVVKVWDDDDWEKRPASVEVTLKANGEDASVDDATVTLNDGNEWTYTWEGLDAADENGAITYTVEETAIEGYTTTYDSTTDESTKVVTWTVTNKHRENEKDVFYGDTTTMIDGHLASAGDVLTYTISYNNNTNEVGAVTVTDKIPDHTDKPTNISEGGIYDESTRTITWTFTGVQPGDGGEVSFSVTVDKEGANGEQIKNDAVVRVGKNDSKTNTVTTNIPVKDVKDEEGASIDGEGVQVGDVLTYEVTFTIDKPVTKAQIEDAVPVGTKYVENSAQAVGDWATEVDDSGDTITWTFDGGEDSTLAKGTYTATFQVKVTEDALALAEKKINNTAIINVNDDPKVKTNVVTNTPEIGDLTISKTVTVPAGFTVDANKEFEFTVKLWDKSEIELAGEYDYDGSYTGKIKSGDTIKLKHGESITIHGLPAGGLYEVTENEEAGYTVQGDNPATGEIVADKTAYAKAAFENAYTTDSVEVDPPVQKVLVVPEGLTGPESIEGAFTFTIENTAKPTSVETAPMPTNTSITNSAQYLLDGETDLYEFGAIEFEVPGEYVYKVTETGSVPGVTNDAQNAKTLTVSVTDTGAGTLDTTMDPEVGKWVFTNTYSAKPIAKGFEVTKDLTGTPLKAGAFEFVLTGKDDAPMPKKTEATNDDSGKVAFNDITFDKPGTYTYEIAETKGSKGGYTYDESTVGVTVKVTDNQKGELEAAVTYDPESATFKNTYEAKGEFTPTAMKELNGRTLEEGQFTFELVDENGEVIETAKNNASGAVQFSTIKYDQTIFDEVASEPESAAPEADAAAEAEVEGVPEVEPESEAEPEATAAEAPAAESDESVEAVDTAEAVPEATPEAEVTDATEAEPQADEAEDGFSFAEAAGFIGFNSFFSPKIAFAEEADQLADAPRSKTFTYTIREVNDGKPGYTYDSHELVYTVTVTDLDNGELQVDVKNEGKTTFVNTYKAKGEVSFSGTKSVTGTELKDGQFSFQLKDADNKVLQTKANAGDGTFAFDALAYTEADAGKTFKYSVTEVNDGQTGYTYDSHVCGVEVKVTDNGDGTLTCEATLSDGDVASFSNPYKPLATSVKITAKKTLKGRDLKAGEFSFKLSDANGKVVKTAQNTAGGNVDFGYIRFDEPGTYTFTAREVKGSLKNVTYDKSVKTYTVTVKDKGGQLEATVSCDDAKATFKNTYKPNKPDKPDKPDKPKVPTKKVLPKTGDPAAAGQVMMYSAAGMASLLTGIKMRRRKRK